MNTAHKKRDYFFHACLGALVCGSIGMVTRVSAQDAPAPTVSREVAIAAATTQDADGVADEKLRRQVQAALHADPYFYDKHVTVSIEDGVVVLRGFVFSSLDLQNALDIARKAAGDKKVVDYLSIKGPPVTR